MRCGRGIMPLAVIMILWLGLTATAALELDQTTLSDYADVVCPYNVICREGESKLPQTIEDRVGCCTDCSCSETCGLTESCCYPSLDVHKIVDRSHQECTYPTSSTPQEAAIGYNMVVDRYPHGSGPECYGSLNESCGEIKDATFFGAMYPVFSKETGRIYKNVKCAKCHGMTEADVVWWKGYLACDQYNRVDISTFLQYFEDGKMTPLCHFSFIYPGPLTDLSTEFCYPNMKQSCSGTHDFHIPPSLNMTTDEVRAACESDFRSIFWRGSLYKNIFCFMCAKYAQKLIPSSTCSTREIQPTKTMLESYFSLLVGRGTQMKTTTKHSDGAPTQKRLACHLMKDTPRDCRYAYCPSGKVPTNSGTCVHLATRLDTVDIILKLLPTQAVHVDTIGNTNFRDLLANKSKSISPWSKNWKIAFLAYKTVTVEVNASSVDYFLLRLEHINRGINIKSLITNIQQNLIKEWTFNLKGYLVPNRQELSEYTKLTVFPNGLMEPENDIPNNETPSFISNLTMPIFQTLVRNSYTRSGFVITKMFFCDQVILKPDEYEYDPRIQILLHKSSGKVFYHGEVAVAYDEVLEYIPKLCLDDAGFRLVGSDANTPRIWKTWVCWLVLINFSCRLLL